MVTIKLASVRFFVNSVDHEFVYDVLGPDGRFLFSIPVVVANVGEGTAAVFNRANENLGHLLQALIAEQQQLPVHS
jgi:hypothetical protein